MHPFSKNLQDRIDSLKKKMNPVKLGRVEFDSPLILAPLASITSIPFRLLMQDLGAGGCVSELVSCHGINYQNEKTLKMLEIDPRERHTGLQIFGECKKEIASASEIAQGYGPAFIDINVGCPVKKVVTKGAGARLLLDIKKLTPIIRETKKRITVPLTLKIRTGWCANDIVAEDIVKMAQNEGIEFVAIHGRTRAQKYNGLANWPLINDIAGKYEIPIIGNGDLHSSVFVKKELKKTNCKALMLGRGPLRFPFIFLESMTEEPVDFFPSDHMEIIKRLHGYMCDYFDHPKFIEIQLKKHILWMSAGYPGAKAFRRLLFELRGHEQVVNYACKYLDEIGDIQKNINLQEPFLSGGEG